VISDVRRPSRNRPTFDSDRFLSGIQASRHGREDFVGTGSGTHRLARF
jgi:hypothetical protein